MSNKDQLLQPTKGARDFYPKEMKTQRGVYKVFDEVLEGFGYDYYDAPMLESFDLYAAKSSREIVEEQSYVFDDRGGRRLVLRPEMTPSIARMVAAKQRELPRVLRWYTVANCWRYERPQKGRLRNFFQLNMDLVGSVAPEADAEIIISAMDILKKLGADMEQTGIQLNDRTLLEMWYEENGITADNRAGMTSLIDRKKKYSTEEWANALQEKGLSPQQSESLETFLNMQADDLPEGEAYDRLRAIIQILKEAGYGDAIVFDPSVVRGFDYYTSTVFEIFDRSGGFRRSVFGGGRYDNLIGDMGGEAVPTVGGAASVIAISSMFDSQGRTMQVEDNARTMVIPFSEGERSAAGDIVKGMRESGVQAMMALPPYDLKKQLKLAEKSNVEKVIFVNPEELKEGKVVVKNMETGEQEIVGVDEL